MNWKHVILLGVGFVVVMAVISRVLDDKKKRDREAIEMQEHKNLYSKALDQFPDVIRTDTIIFDSDLSTAQLQSKINVFYRVVFKGVITDVVKIAEGEYEVHTSTMFYYGKPTILFSTKEVPLGEHLIVAEVDEYDYKNKLVRGELLAVIKP